MGLFDRLKSDAVSAAVGAAKQLGTKTERVIFSPLPDTLEQFQALPQAAMASPFDTAAMTILALCFFPRNKELWGSRNRPVRTPGRKANASG